MLYTHQAGFNQIPLPNQIHPVFMQGTQPIHQVMFSERRLEHINCILPETQEQGALFIGDTIATLRTQYLTENNIKAVLCCNSQAAKNVHMTRIPFDYKYIQIKDHPEYPIKLHFESASEFIDSKIKGKKNVLVQCHGGASRSVTLVIAYLMKVKGWSLEKTLQFVKQKRHRAKPNVGFWKQLEQYETLLIQNKIEQNEMNFKTPTKLLKPQKTQIITPDTYDKNEKTEEKHRDNELESEKESSQKVQSSQNVKSQQVILSNYEESSKQMLTSDSMKHIFGQDERKKCLIRQSQIIRHQTAYQYFQQQNYYQRASDHRTLTQPKTFPPTNYIHQPIYQATINQPYTPFQLQQPYYISTPQTNYVSYPNKNQPMWISRVF